MSIDRDMDGCGGVGASWACWRGGSARGGRRRRVSGSLAVVVGYRVAVATWQCVGWTGNEPGIILRGDFVKIGVKLTEIWICFYYDLP
jgi:hypothetical protein